MAVIPEITCRRCGSTYSGLRSRCPKCGAPRINQPTRVPPTTASATQQTAASARSAVNIRWQFVFAAVLVLALILAVVGVVSGGKNGGSSASASSGAAQTGTTGSATYIAADLPTPSPSPEPTPDASPTPMIESMAITFLNKTITRNEMTLTEPLTTFTTYGINYNIDLDLSVYPAIDNLQVTWRSSNENILTVEEHGFVTVVGASPDMEVHAAIFVEAGGMEDYVVIRIPAFQAYYLTDNRFNQDTYFADTLELDTMHYATPTPKP